MVTELTKGVFWVGVVDWGLTHFHGFELSTHRGSTYNAYLIADEKVAAVCHIVHDRVRGIPAAVNALESSSY